MAEERTLGLARVREDSGEEPSKEALQRRLDETRDSISQTVTEIKETVANQVQAVKQSLDWREQFKKRPIAWSAGAAGVGFLVGYGVAAAVKGDGRSDSYGADYYAPQARSYAQQSLSSPAQKPVKGNGHQKDEGPGLLEKLSSTPAYGRVKDEFSNVGDALIEELGKTAKQVVLPALITSIKNFVGGYLPADSKRETSRNASTSTHNEPTQPAAQNESAYQPKLDH